MAICSGVVGYWVIDRQPPTDFIGMQVVEDESVTPGGRLKVEYKVNRRKNCAVTLEQVLFDAKKVRYILPEQKYTIEPGSNGPEEFVLAVPIPDKFAVGEGRFRAIRSYVCNPIQAWFWPLVVQQPDVYFDVRHE
jgi:hypothetical protein